MKRGISSSRLRPSAQAQAAPRPAISGTIGSQLIDFCISSAMARSGAGHSDMSMSGGAVIIPASISTCGAVGCSTALNSDAASGCGRTHPASRAWWNNVPSVTWVILSARIGRHWVSISRSPGYLVTELADHSSHRVSAASACCVW